MSNDLAYLLQNINSNIGHLSNDISQVHKNLEVIYGQANETQERVAGLDNRLQLLIEEFLTFVDSDRKAKSLQISETRIVKARQELEQKFHHYGDVRRVSQAIMQTLDSGTLNEKVLSDVTDELMLKTPRYWLAAVSVALAAWVSDDKELAETALQEAFRRDDYKTSLFFCLICNRLNRPAATLKWIERYFQHQDPARLDREFVVILNAIAGGVFPAQSAAIAVHHVKNWMSMLGNEAQIKDTISKRWISRLSTMHGPSSKATFPTMKVVVANFDEYQSYLEMTSTFEEHVKFLTGIFTANVSKGNLVQKIDQLLVRLSSDFDDEELPLHREVRRLSLIIENNGDEQIAQKKFESETQVFEANVDILQIITNTAMNPEQASADILTQRLSLTLSKDALLDAHGKYTHHVRGQRPHQAHLKIFSFSGMTADGTNESTLMRDFEAHMIKEKTKALDAFAFGPKHWAMLACAVVLLVVAFSASSWLAGLGGLGLGGWILNHYFKTKDAKQNLEREYKNRISHGIQQIKGACAELVDYLQVVAKGDPYAEKFKDVLSSYIPENSIQSEHRKIVA